MAGKKLGPRVTIAVGKGSDGKAVYSYMLKKNAELFGFKATTSAIRKGKGGRIINYRGAASGEGAIKVPTGKTKKIKDTTHKIYVRMPMPSGMSINKIQAFLKKATKNKPDHFVSADGQTWPVA